MQISGIKLRALHPQYLLGPNNRVFMEASLDVDFCRTQGFNCGYKLHNVSRFCRVECHLEMEGSRQNGEMAIN